MEQFVEELEKHDIDDTNIIGLFEKSLGGMTFWDIHDGDINKGMTISEEDSHPNAKGHELIARYFYENTKCEPKGRRLQQWFRDLLIEKLDIHPEDIELEVWVLGGEDLIMARSAREKFPYSIECKNQESINIWKSYEQAPENAKDYEPIVVLKRNKTKLLVLVDAKYFTELHKKDLTLVSLYVKL